MKTTTGVLGTIIILVIALAGCSGSDAGSNYLPNLPYTGGGGGDYDPYEGTYYENYGTNEFIFTDEETTSTFGMDVDTASYTRARVYINDGLIPDIDSIRTEEFINYFDQDYNEPDDRDIFFLMLEGAESEFGHPDYHLLKIGVKARDVSPDERPPANIVFVVDTSGSMSGGHRLGQVKRCLRMLAENLMAGDKIGLVEYGTTGHVISGLTANHNVILGAIDELEPNGSTNAQAGLTLGYTMAREGYEEGKINRVILCSDGVANVGVTDPNDLLAQVKDDAEVGITLTTLGFGMGNYNDVLMEKLANHGDGCYYYIDSDQEADRLFEGGAVRILLVLASDGKVQAEFNTATVEKFRLIGYENRVLDNEDFEDDSVDAGEVCAGQTVTALYELKIRDEALGDPMAHVATVRIRYQNYETKEIEFANEKPFTVGDMIGEFDEASRCFRFTAAVTEFAEILRECVYAEGSSFESILNVAEPIAESEKETEFIDLVNKMIQIPDG